MPMDMQERMRAECRFYSFKTPFPTYTRFVLLEQMLTSGAGSRLVGLFAQSRSTLHLLHYVYEQPEKGSFYLITRCHYASIPSLRVCS